MMTLAGKKYLQRTVRSIKALAIESCWVKAGQDEDQFGTDSTTSTTFRGRLLASLFLGGLV